MRAIRFFLLGASAIAYCIFNLHLCEERIAGYMVAVFSLYLVALIACISFRLGRKRGNRTESALLDKL